MPHFIVRSKGTERWSVRLADCSRAHAEAVLGQLSSSPDHPHDLYLQELAEPYGEKSPSIVRRRQGVAGRR